MEITPPIISAVILGSGYYAVSVVINAKIKPLNMRRQAVLAVVMAAIMFTAVFLIMNFVLN